MPSIPTAGDAVAANLADGGVGDPQAHLQPVGRGAMRALDRDPVLQVSVRLSQTLLSKDNETNFGFR